MEDKESYTPNELEEALIAYAKYIDNKINFAHYSFGGALGILPSNKIPRYKEFLEDSMKECKEKLPTSLIDKFEIDKLE